MKTLTFAHLRFILIIRIKQVRKRTHSVMIVARSPSYCLCGVTWRRFFRQNITFDLPEQ
jgi:hypothetical protein